MRIFREQICLHIKLHDLIMDELVRRFCWIEFSNCYGLIIWNLVNHEGQSFPTIHYQSGTDAYNSAMKFNSDSRVYFDRII